MNTFHPKKNKEINGPERKLYLFNCLAIDLTIRQFTSRFAIFWVNGLEQTGITPMKFNQRFVSNSRAEFLYNSLQS